MYDPETFCNNTLPEVAVDAKNEIRTQSINHSEPAPHRLSRKNQIISVAIMAAVMIGIALGVGIREGLKKKSSARSNSSRYTL